MWIYKIKTSLNEHGYYPIPDNFNNLYNYDNSLKIDEFKLIKSSILNWFCDRYKNNECCVVLNGHYSIILNSDIDYTNQEYNFMNFNIMDGYLMYHENQSEYCYIMKMLERHKKLTIITEKWVEKH